MTGQPQDQVFWKRVLLWTPGDEGRPERYGGLFIAILLLIWLPSLAYLKLAKPVFTSKWTLNLPGTGVNASVHLENIGQASTSSTSAYGTHTINPSTNYKQIAESKSVLELAAKKMKMDEEEFDKPRITLVDQTTMIFFEIQGKTAEEAQKKSYAFYEALETTLNHLRQDEIHRREESVKNMLSGAQEKLKQTRDQLLAYQAESKVVAIEQFNQFTASLEQLKVKLSELKVDQSSLIGERNQLIKILNLTAHEASQAMILQADAVFSENNKHYAQAGALLAKQMLKMGENHPEVIKARNEVSAAKQKMVNRIILLFGNQGKKLIDKLMLSSDSSLGVVFEKLITLDTQVKGNIDKIAQLENQIDEMNERLEKDMKAAATLDDLKRDHQIAEAVFTSALARIDTGKTDIYASYPLIQILTPPDLPAKPTSPNKKFVLLGSAGGTILAFIGMALLWSRKNLLRKILLNG